MGTVQPSKGEEEVGEGDSWVGGKVKNRGGIREVIVERRWPEIVKLMPLPKTCTNAGFSLKIVYQKYLLDFERVTMFGLPDIPPSTDFPRGGMPIPQYPPENVAMEDPFQGAERGKKSKRIRTDEGRAFWVSFLFLFFFLLFCKKKATKKRFL